MKTKKDYKKLIKIYTKKLNALHKMNLTSYSACLDYFIVYLQFLRDRYIITEELVTNDQENIKIASLETAIQEYQEYITCINKYFNISKTNVTPKVPGTKEEIIKAYNKEKLHHWAAFWEVLKDHFENWEDENA